ncbi:MAG: hypothetical protein RLZZ502_1649, partial [Pseudomonadota bacterium]
FKRSKVGIVGYGAIGKRTAQLAKALGAEVMVHRLGGQREADGLPVLALADLLPRCDIISLHCPLTPATRGLIGARELAMMSANAILVNTARGGLVDEAALAQALHAGQIFAAGIDSFAQEPLPIHSALCASDRVLLTPHIAGVTLQSARQVALQTAQNIIDFFQTKP